MWCFLSHKQFEKDLLKEEGKSDNERRRLDGYLSKWAYRKMRQERERERERGNNKENRNKKRKKKKVSEQRIGSKKKKKKNLKDSLGTQKNPEMRHENGG